MQEVEIQLKQSTQSQHTQFDPTQLKNSQLTTDGLFANTQINNKHCLDPLSSTNLLFSLPARDVCRGVYCHALEAAISGSESCKHDQRVASVAEVREPDAKAVQALANDNEQCSPTNNQCLQPPPTSTNQCLINAQRLNSMQLAQPDTWPSSADGFIAECHQLYAPSLKRSMHNVNTLNVINSFLVD